MDGATRRDFLAALGMTTLASGLAGSVAELQAADERKFGPSDLPRTLERSSADMGSLYPRLAEMLQANESRLFGPSWNGTFDDAFRGQARQRVADVLQYTPPPVDLRPEVVDRVDCGDFVREKVIYSTAPWFRVPAYVLIPKGRTNPGPAIVDLHSHGGMFLFGKEKVIDLGDNHPTMVDYHAKNYDGRPTATELARRGYVVLSADTFMFGERRLIMDDDLPRGWDRANYSPEVVAQLNAKCRAKESTLAKSLVFAGTTWPGIVSWDDMRAVDYLASRPEVDANRIGCVGISMGGYRSLYLGARDPRIAATCIVGFMSTTAPMLQAHIDTHSWVHFLPGLHRWLDWPELAALSAPRALLVQQCSQDRLFPLTGMQESIRRIGDLYASAGVPDRFSGRFYDEPHRWTRAMQDEAFDWLDRQLKGAGK